MQKQKTRFQVIELGFYSNGWMTLFLPRHRGTDSLTKEEFVQNISDLKSFFEIRSGPNAPRIHNAERKYWAIPPENVRLWPTNVIVEAIKGIWQRQGVEVEVETYHHDHPFNEAKDLT